MRGRARIGFSPLGTVNRKEGNYYTVTVHMVGRENVVSMDNRRIRGSEGKARPSSPPVCNKTFGWKVPDCAAAR